MQMFLVGGPRCAALDIKPPYSDLGCLFFIVNLTDYDDDEVHVGIRTV